MLPRLLLAHRLLAAPLPRSLPRRTAAVVSAAPALRGHRSPLRGVVFDMDGTLTVPVIDFPAMYREVLGRDAARAAGGGSVDILHCIESWAPDELVAPRWILIWGLGAMRVLGRKADQKGFNHPQCEGRS